MSAFRFILLTILLTATTAAQQSPQPCAGLPAGKHAVLERMTADFGLTCEQELKIEPLLHDEESVTRPLLRFTSFSAEQQRAVMLKIKLAARRQIRSLLTLEQEKLMDVDMQNVARSSAKGGRSAVQSGSGPGNSDALENEEALSKAVMNYIALRPEEKKAIVLEIKRAIRADSRQQLTSKQQRALDSEIADLSKSAPRN
jgi:hypothetical protein